MSSANSEASRRLSEVLEVYLTKKQREAWSTRQWRRQAWRRLIEAVGDIDVAEFGYDDLEDYESYLYANGQNANGVRSYLKAVSKVIGWCQRRNWCRTNPFDGFRYPRRIDGPLYIYSDRELRSLMAAAPDDRWRALVALVATAGLRRSEALNLRIEDVDFERKTITIQPHKATLSSWAWTPKSYQRRTVPLVDEVSRLLCALLADEIPAGQPYVCLTEERYWHLRERHRAGRMTERQRLCPDENFNPAFRRIRREAGLERGTYHDLRRTCLTIWSRHVPPQELHKLAGHASIATTMQYYLGVGADIMERVQRLNIIGATGLEPATS